MSRTSTLILFGVLIAITPFSGLPMTFRSLLEVIFGIVVLGIGFSLRAHEVRRHATHHAPPAEHTDDTPHGVSPI